jgi:hypothetical protein
LYRFFKKVFLVGLGIRSPHSYAYTPRRGISIGNKDAHSYAYTPRRGISIL